MALTPEQVINKTFQPTKFREGYDQEEVDLFLDEVVAELRRLEKENDELRQRLREAGLSDSLDGEDRGTDSATGAAGSIAALNTAGDSAVSTSARPEEETVQTVTEEPAAAEPAESVVAEQGLAPAGDADLESASLTEEEPEEETVVSESVVAEPTAPAAAPESAQSAAAVIAMAQRLHDEYVSEGQTERARLISEGQVTAESMVAEAEAKRREVMESLDTDKATLESDVEALRAFESTYRARLREHLEAKLTELEQTPTLEPRDTRA